MQRGVRGALSHPDRPGDVTGDQPYQQADVPNARVGSKAVALYRQVERKSAGAAASRSKAETPTKPPPMMQKICRQISDGTDSLVMP